MSHRRRTKRTSPNDSSQTSETASELKRIEQRNDEQQLGKRKDLDVKEDDVRHGLNESETSVNTVSREDHDTMKYVAERILSHTKQNERNAVRRTIVQMCV